jgi:hypothetical protein
MRPSRQSLRLVLAGVVLIGGAFVVGYFSGWAKGYAFHTTGASRLRQQGSESPATPVAPEARSSPPVLMPSAGTRGSPKIRFQNVRYDFGTVTEGDVVSHAFPFENCGTASLTIRGLAGDCGCTAAVASARTIEPGQTGQIRVSFKTQDYKGKQVREVYVTSDDQATPRARLTLSGFVRAYLDINPSYVYFGTIGRAAKVAKLIHVTSSEGARFRITSLKATSPRIRLSEVRRAEAGGYQFEITAGPGLEPGMFFARAIIGTNLPGRPTSSLQIFGNVIAAREGQRR